MATGAEHERGATMRDVGKHKAARLASEGGFGQWGGEAREPLLLHSNRFRAGLQEAKTLGEDRRESERLQ